MIHDKSKNKLTFHGKQYINQILETIWKLIKNFAFNIVIKIFVNKCKILRILKKYANLIHS